ncbi:alpha/beta fold hydrolase [Actinokineospora sp. PR83]|nr:alpha/beta fold hydrolase [Actinokineospora sp. PR83]
MRRFHRAPGAGTRLVCLPHAGGSATAYFALSAALSPRVEVLAAQYPGRPGHPDTGDAESIDELADRITTATLAHADSPIALFGHSMGATLAFEVARRLEAQGVPPVALFASGRRAPSVHRPGSVHLYNDEELLAELKEVGGPDTGPPVDEEVLRAFLPAIRRDYRAIETYTYRPGPGLRCPIVALTGDRDPRVGVDDMRSWRSHTTAAFDLAVFPGGHFYLVEQVEAVARAIRGGPAQQLRGVVATGDVG